MCRVSVDPGSLALFAHELQQVLHLPVQLGNFVSNDDPSVPLPTPCSLVGVYPFAAGGTRRLILNACSPLVARCAGLCTARAGTKERMAAMALGTAMLETASWPMLGLDSPVPTIRWNRVLNSGPMTYYTCPTQIVQLHEKANEFRNFVVEYKRIISRSLLESKDLKTLQDVVETFGDRLVARDDALMLELASILDSTDVRTTELVSSACSALLASLTGSGTFAAPAGCIATPSSSIPSHDAALSSFFPLSCLGPADSLALKAAREACTLPADAALLTYSSMLPVLLRAFSFSVPDPAAPSPSEEEETVAPAERLGAAFYELGSEDRLFCLSLWFRIPLIDRTGILQGPVRVAVEAGHCRPMVTKEEVAAFEASGVTLEAACMARARALWEETEVGDGGEALGVQVAWSGGIDSTAALVSLMATARERAGRWERLFVILDEESVSEYPLFYDRFIAGARPPVKEVRGDRQSLGSLAGRGDRITVTGELGDQLFGSDKTRNAFLPPQVENLITGEALPNPFAAGLEAPWQQTLLPALRDEGLLCGTEQQWEAWIAPQLARSPVPIRSTFDMLWWLNFSCKWRQVMLRCIHDVGPIPPSVAGRAGRRGEAAGSVAGVLGGFRHFFDDAGLESWACCPANHARKYGDLRDWRTYKAPLKEVILGFTGDAAYFAEKTKVGSLFREGEASLFSAASMGILAGSAHLLRWGALSLSSSAAAAKYGTSLAHLLPPARRPQSCALESPQEELWRCGPPAHRPLWTTTVDPWAAPPVTPDPFEAAPGFVDTDERQERAFNPVTGVTLAGKCAALLPPAMVRGRSVLDLGACLGAMCHYALAAGAREAVAVEAQPELCRRAEALLREQWAQAPGGGGGRGVFRVVESGIQEFLGQCADGAFDVVVAAGVLHCFTDPVRVLLEVCRVARVAAAIESVHPHLVRQGFLPETARTAAAIRCANSTLQVLPSSRCNLAGETLSLAGLAVLPTRQLVEELCRAGGMQTTRVRLRPHPSRPDDVLTYTGPRRLSAAPMRFFLRCFHLGPRRTFRTLEDQVLSGEGEVVGWGRSARIDNSFTQVGAGGWRRGGAEGVAEGLVTEADAKEEAEGGEVPEAFIPEAFVPGEGELPRGAIPEGVVGEAGEAGEGEGRGSPTGAWAFNLEVARDFDRIAAQHIPDYHQVIALSVEALRDHFGPGGEGAQGEAAGRELGGVRVMDVGSATGNTLLALLAAGLRRVEGIDASRDMNSIARERLPGTVRIAEGESFPAGEKYDALLANWTVHFVKGEAAREAYIRELAAGLEEGGLLVLTEKTTQTAKMQRMYKQWKRAQGATEEEVRRKEKQLVGVLETLPAAWYERVLREAGLREVAVAWQRLGFVTWVACK